MFRIRLDIVDDIIVVSYVPIADFASAIDGYIAAILAEGPLSDEEPIARRSTYVEPTEFVTYVDELGTVHTHAADEDCD